MNNFNLIAPFYDLLSRLIFKDNLLKAQLTFLDRLEPADKVLILGGGTGELLEFLPKCQKVVYLEKSKKMLIRARKRSATNSTSFVQMDFLKGSLNESYDVIICPFFLDCFNEGNLHSVIFKCRQLLKKDGCLIVSDFQKTNSNKPLLVVMHLFFRIFTAIDSSQLKEIDKEVLLGGFQKEEEKFFHRNQVFSRLYRNL